MADERLDGALVTDRLLLRRPQASDAPRIAALINDPAIARMTTKIPHPYHLADAEVFCADASESDLKIETLAGELVGGIGVDSGHAGIPELGYWLGRPYWGHGLATEAVGAVLAWVRLNRRAIVAGHFSDNAASGRVLIKSDFLYTGEIQERFSRARGAVANTRMMIWLA